ncbi:hypothetical protein TCAL_08768 [Tigriopus californicus]|uniref:Roadblock/LAMTOR2 domain-containing protein n=1 Tax=Tigriopus californicus TaxID=6832 RepID=A0A553PKQ9_TIGCA|nr:uncharacterized protein LOC131891020 [Tigriopus californicus]TRY78275.1 hypothetical protein TCAL_08768 [Tigriopus californicus]|eukprot:TCALIF_08768-PA protein Name:"Similar to CG5189 Ragulator complex protein LAMTOR2 homolog (Drosophila melanogaster)" AED:0.00 eAED:0.00 QI:22/1/1/1/1/1/2/14/143
MTSSLLAPEALATSLSAVTTPQGGVHSALLLTAEGQVMGYSRNLNLSTAAFKAGLMATLWRAELSAAQSARNDGLEMGPLEHVLIENDEGFVALAACSNFVVGLEASSHVQLGMLKKKALVLAQALAQPLKLATPLSWNGQAS